MNMETYKFILEFIDVMAQRGAIKGDELFNVGALRRTIMQEIENFSNDSKENIEEKDE